MAKNGAKPTPQDIQIYTAGTVPLPPNYPEIGILTETKTTVGDRVLHIEHRVSPRQSKRYVVRREDVTAIRLAKDGSLDPKTEKWLLGADARTGALTASADGKTYGIAYVRESVGVVVKVEIERSVTAGEIEEEAVVCECKEKYCLCE